LVTRTPVIFTFVLLTAFRKNPIKNLDDLDGNGVFSHQAKALILHDFYKSLLGTPIYGADHGPP
jgi:hypothetical protein